MNKIKFYAIAVCILLMAVIVSCNSNKRSNSSETEKSTETALYLPFADNGKYGAKNKDGNIIIQAEYDKVEVAKGLIFATRGNETFIFNGEKPIFNSGVHYYSIEDKYITANHNDENLLYFFDTELAVENMYICYYQDKAFLCQFPDESYAFYSEDGIIKANNLQRISCLQKIKDGNIVKQYLAFRKEDAGRLILTTTGDLLYDIDLTTWQRIAITYLKRDNSDDREYELTYNYKIDLDRCIKDHISGTYLLKYPEE